MSNLSFSVVICTLNRCESLKRTLDAALKLKADWLEIIVVNGPSEDNTSQLLNEYSDRIVVFKNDIANISKSRQIALIHAKGSIIVSLDDDVIPPENWLLKIGEVYDREGELCGAVGGIILDKTRGEDVVQYAYGYTNLISRDKVFKDKEFQFLTQNLQNWFPMLMGANSSYRRSALETIGGFDEFYEYFLEETDVCVRLTKAGYRIHYTNVEVDHYPAKSHNRKNQKWLTCWYSIAKNTTYFAIKHGLEKTLFPIFIVRLASLLTYRCFLRIIRLKLFSGVSSHEFFHYVEQTIEGIKTGWVHGMHLYYASNKR
jgi:glycosyltransferase involved in cell wall biosynthesis